MIGSGRKISARISRVCATCKSIRACFRLDMKYEDCRALAQNPEVFSKFSLALRLMHSIGSILFKSGSCMVARAARPRFECRISNEDSTLGDR